MIQRIQTLYLLLIVVLGIALCFLPVVQLTTPEEAAQQHIYEMKAIGLEELGIRNEELGIGDEAQSFNGSLTAINGEKLNGGVSQTTSQENFNSSLMDVNGESPAIDGAPAAVGLNGLWGLLLTTLCIPVLALVDIFLYRKRILQARLNIFLAVLCVGYYGILAMFIWFAKMNLGTTEWHLYAWSGIPLICLVLTLMATRRILKDEALVRAADRLR